MLALDIKDLLIQYPQGKKNFTAVDHVNFQIQEGEFFGLLGPNGAGKTSIIAAITSLVAHQSGAIRVFDSEAGSSSAKRQLGYVPQELVSYGFFNVNEVLTFVSGYFGIRQNQKKIDELLERLQLTDLKYRLISHLSGGMKRRFLIAKALLHNPKILLLDEPSAGVDVELRTILWDYALELNRNGMTILLTTHYLEEAERLCKRVAIMDRGKILALDETATIKTKMGGGNLESAFLKLIKKEGAKS